MVKFCKKEKEEAQVPRAQPPILNPHNIPNGVPRYVLDMDLPPLERYSRLIGDHKEHFKEVDAFVDSMTSMVSMPTAAAFAVKCIQGVLNLGNKLSLVYYSDELAAIAELSGMPLGRVVMMQLIYEASALCTSVTLPRHSDGHMGHIRTMDWAMSFLKKLTVEIEIKSRGETLALATTWAGYVGVLTGVAIRGQTQARDGFSVSVNFRSDGSGTLATNLQCALSRSWPIGFLVRETLVRADNYSTCVSWLSHSKLIAPCYFTVCGSQNYKSCLLTRDRKTCLWPLHFVDGRGASAAMVATGPCGGCASDGEAASEVVLGTKRTRAGESSPTYLKPSHCLVQPNTDHWCEEDENDPRRTVTARLLSAITKAYGVFDAAAVAAAKAEAKGARAPASRSQKAKASRTDEADEDGPPHAVATASASATSSSEKAALANGAIGYPPRSYIPDEKLWDVMSREPVLNDITIYGTLMDPRLGTLETRLPYRPKGTKAKGYKGHTF